MSIAKTNRRKKIMMKRRMIIKRKRKRMRKNKIRKNRRRRLWNSPMLKSRIPMGQIEQKRRRNRLKSKRK